jgi:hypothetical protein
MKAAAPKRVGPETLTGSAPAKRTAVVILEVLSGVCGPVDGSRQLGISLTRYYALETRGLQGLLQALEPRPRGRRGGGVSPDAVHERQRLEREVLRLQALVRATQRAVALAPPKPARGGRRKTAPRARKVIAQLRAASVDAAGASPSA